MNIHAKTDGKWGGDKADASACAERRLVVILNIDDAEVRRRCTSVLPVLPRFSALRICHNARNCLFLSGLREIGLCDS
jgi:hypothetical protein